MSTDLYIRGIRRHLGCASMDRTSSRSPGGRSSGHATFRSNAPPTLLPRDSSLTPNLQLGKGWCIDDLPLWDTGLPPGAWPASADGSHTPADHKQEYERSGTPDNSGDHRKPSAANESLQPPKSVSSSSAQNDTSSDQRVPILARIISLKNAVPEPVQDHGVLLRLMCGFPQDIRDIEADSSPNRKTERFSKPSSSLRTSHVVTEDIGISTEKGRGGDKDTGATNRRTPADRASVVDLRGPRSRPRDFPRRQVQRAENSASGKPEGSSKGMENAKLRPLNIDRERRSTWRRRRVNVRLEGQDREDVVPNNEEEKKHTDNEFESVSLRSDGEEGWDKVASDEEWEVVGH